MSSSMPDKQYVLSLDSLDLSLLCQFVDKPSNGKQTLWSKTFLDGESTYCQVNMTCDEYQNEDNYFAVSETYQCHICNKDVPKIYYKQHVQSKMHHNYRKLTEKVLENLTKQINADVDTIDYIEHYNQFYCETCSKVVLLEFKQKHNNSAYHLKSLENQRLTDDFIEVYLGNEETEVVNNHDRKLDFQNNTRDDTENINNLLEAENGIIDNKSHTGRFLINRKICNNSDLLSFASSTELSENSDSDEFKLFDCSEEITNFQVYIKDMIERYHLQYKIPAVDYDSIIIVTPKGFREKISVYAFHGLRSNVLPECQLCETWLYCGFMDHIRTENHVRNITQPVNDDFTRDVIQSSHWRHCLLCNMKVLKGSNHTALIHKQYAQGNENKAIKLPKKSCDISNKTFCEACNRHIDKQNFKCHAKSKKHKNNLKIISKSSPEVVLNNNSSSNKDDNKTSTTYCDVCNKNIDSHNFTSHTKGNKHKEKLKAKVDKSSSALMEINCTQNKHEQNEITNQKSSPVVLVESNISTQKAVLINEMYCYTCKVKVPNGGMEIHIKGKKHKEKCQKENKTIYNTTSEPKQLVTNQYLPNLMPSTSSQEHVKKITIEEKLIEYNKQMAPFGANELECLVCQVKIPNKDKNIIEHVEASKHTTNMNNLLHVSKISKKSSKYFHCELCDSYIDNFIDHINKDVNHIFKFFEFYKVQLTECVHDNPLKTDALACAYRRLHKEMLERNKIIKISNKYYHCGACGMGFPVRQEIEHMLSLDHLLDLKSRPS